MLQFICSRLCLALERIGPLLLLLLLLPASATAADKLKVEVVPQVGHSGDITTTAISRDDRLIASGSTDNTIKLWDAASGRLLRTLVGHASTYANKKLVFPEIRGKSGELWTEAVYMDEKGNAQISAVAFAPDGKRIVSGSRDGTTRVWETATGRLLRKFELRTPEGFSRWVTAVAFSPDGSRILVGGYDSALRLLDAATGRQIRALTGHEGVRAITFSTDGRRVLTGGTDKVVKLWDVGSGRMLHSFEGHAEWIDTVAFSPDQTIVISASRDGKMRLWNAATGARLTTFDTGPGISAVSRDGRRVASADFNEVKLWDISSGRLMHTVKMDMGPISVNAVGLSSDGSRLLTGHNTVTRGILVLTDAASGAALSHFSGQATQDASVTFSSDGSRLLWSSRWSSSAILLDAVSGRFLRSFQAAGMANAVLSPSGNAVLIGAELWDAETGERLRTLSELISTVSAFSPGGKLVALGGYEKLELRDAASGRLLHAMKPSSPKLRALAFSPDGQWLATAGESIDPSKKLAFDLWNVREGRLQRSFVGHEHWTVAIAYSPNGTSILTGNLDNTAILWDAAKGRQLARLAHVGRVNGVAFSPDGRRLLTGSDDRTAKLWDASTGRLLLSFEGHSDKVSSVAFSADGQRVLTSGGDGTVRVWNASSGQELAGIAPRSGDNWLALTRSGFFNKGRDGEIGLHLVRGIELTTLEQTYRSLYNPDLVREALAGDPDGEVKRAAEVVNLDKVIDSGPAPVVEIVTPETGKAVTTDIVTATARIADKGKGIGRIEWRVNGVTAAVSSAPPGSGPDYAISQQLALDRGDNSIELVAYNASNLLASLPARVAITASPTDTEKPKLHVLAIGINDYVDKGSVAPGAKTKTAFGPLSLAVKDAAALAAALKRAGAQQYAEVKVTEALDTNATVGGLQQTIERMAQEIHPRDTFVLFAAAHGTSHNGRFYLIPQDYDGGTNPTALQQRAIGQDRLQDWVANKIKAKKVLILLDTCESGALVSGTSRSRTDAPASEAALGRLHEATGRPVLTAAAEGKPAFEGFEGHGVFTWALLDALKNGDRNGNSAIELSELVAHVQDQVPKIAASLNGRGRAAIVTRGATSDRQSARFGSRGEDFSLVQRLQ